MNLVPKPQLSFQFQPPKTTIPTKRKCLESPDPGQIPTLKPLKSRKPLPLLCNFKSNAFNQRTKEHSSQTHVIPKLSDLPNNKPTLSVAHNRAKSIQKTAELK